MKSALTAALSGKPGQDTASRPPAATPSADRFAFPCLAVAPGASDVDDLAKELETLDVGKFVPVGSAPTNTLMQNGTPLADYPLHPFKRRGGREAYPSSVGASLERASSQGFSLSNSMQSNYMSEAIIGSLPKGLTAEEKLFIAQNTPMSPSLSLLKELSSDRVSSRTAEGRKLRRSVLKGAVVVFVTAGYSGKRFIFEKAKELGVKSVVIDGPDSWVQLLAEDGIVERFLPLDFSDADSVFDRCLQAIRKVGSELGGLDGITTFCEMAVPLVARLAEKLGLPGNTPASVDAARDKYQTRAMMEKAGLPTPRHYMINSVADLEGAGKHVEFPAVIKPISGAASIGVIRVNDMAQLATAYTRVQNDLRRCKVVAGALSEGNDEDEETSGNAGTWMNLQVMLEEYLDGDEIDCDLLFTDDGLCVYGAITDNWPTVEPYFNETGSNSPSILPYTKQRELLELSVNSVRSLGLTLGVFHVECKYTSRGARLIEVNCRMGGGPVRDTNMLVWGVDLVEEHLLISAGIRSRPPVARKPLMNIAEYSVNAKTSGIIKNTDFLNKWQKHPDVLYAKPLVKPGDKVVCVEDGLPTWLCEIMVTKPTVEEAIAFVNEIESGMDIPIV